MFEIVFLASFDLQWIDMCFLEIEVGLDEF